MGGILVRLYLGVWPKGIHEVVVESRLLCQVAGQHLQTRKILRLLALGIYYTQELGWLRGNPQFGGLICKATV